MDVNTRNRAELKSYFVKNSIPTESNFAELIDGLLNQKEDGLVKLPDNPLSIEAAGDEAGTKSAINLYRNFGEAQPDWTLSLNPRSNPDQPGTARLGFNIGDGQGNSRLFIDSSSGNVGIGTIEPDAARLVVNGSFKAASNVSGEREILLEPPSDGKHRITPAEAEEDTYKTGLVYRAKRNPASGAPIFQVRSEGQAVRLFVDHDGWTGSRSNSAWFGGSALNYFAGSVGIGITDPGASKLKIARSETDFADFRFARSGSGQLEFVGWAQGWNINNKTDGQHLFINRDAGQNSDVLIGRNGKELLVRGSDGNVGIGANSPIARLDIKQNRSGTHPDSIKGLYVTGDFEADSDGVEFRHANGTQGIGFGYNTIYATGSNTNQNLSLKPRGDGQVIVSGTLQADKYVVQNSVNGGSSKGIWMWKATDSNWGIYMSQAGDGRSLADKKAVAGAGFSSHAIRFRTYSNSGNGLIYENHQEELNLSVRASDGQTYIRGSVGIGRDDPKAKLDVNGAIKASGGLNIGGSTDHIEADGSFYRYDGQVYITVDDNLYIRDRGGDIAAHFKTNSGALQVNGTTKTEILRLGDKWRLSGVGDAHGDDGWLRFFNTKNSDYYGGIAAGRVYAVTGRLEGSDLRRKKDIVDLENALEKIISLKGVKFRWRDAETTPGLQIGLIAQQVEPVFPELVEVGPDGMKALNHTGLIAPLIEAVKELKAEVDLLKQGKAAIES